MQVLHRQYQQMILPAFIRIRLWQCGSRIPIRSYVNKFIRALILGLDACRYEDNKNIAIVGGRLKPETKSWALKWIMSQKKAYNGLRYDASRHPEHYYGQNQLTPDMS
jgi:hypothetical protein